MLFVSIPLGMTKTHEPKSCEMLAKLAKDEQYVHHYQDMIRAMPEHHRRWHAAMLVQQLDGKGIALIARITGLSRPTVYKGIRELKEGAVDFARPRQRAEHNGAPPTIEQRCPGIDEDLQKILNGNLGGDPMGNSTLCVRMSSRKILAELQRRGHNIKSHVAVIRLLKKTTSRS
jgi:DNA-binding phage protein